jgi:lipoyl(octanoyl) transferase
MIVTDLGQMSYRGAWALQEQAHEEVLAGGEERLLVVEHFPVITFGRRGESAGTLVSSPRELEAAGIEQVKSDRGGDVTYHGPGQIVAYPIVRLADHKLSVSGYVHRLEQVVIDMLADLGVSGFTDPQAVGVWVKTGDVAAKICAIGVRIRRGVTLHGLALNVRGDLAGFGHIVPCGLAGRPVTSVARVADEAVADMDRARQLLVAHLLASFPAGKLSSISR